MEWEINEPSRFLFLGNTLWLDFVNTEKIADGERVDLLKSGADLSAWLTEAGIGSRLTPDEVERLLGQARELRTILRRMAEKMSQGDSIPKEAIEAINGLLRLRLGITQLVHDGDHWEQEFQSEEAGTDAALIPLAQSAADLLTAGNSHLVRQCESAKCILYFYDTSKNHKRRWCSMAGCGNRQKAAEHYRRTRQGEE